MKNTVLFALALIASATTIAPTVALAFEPAAVTSVVRTADLDLSNADGRLELQRRIVRAAYEVCGTASDADLEGKNDARQCRKETISQAAAQREQLFAAAGAGRPIIIASTR